MSTIGLKSVNDWFEKCQGFVLKCQGCQGCQRCQGWFYDLFSELKKIYFSNRIILDILDTFFFQSNSSQSLCQRFKNNRWHIVDILDSYVLNTLKDCNQNLKQLLFKILQDN